jgi:hypothetical protein
MRDVMENNTRPLSELWKGIDAWDFVHLWIQKKSQSSGEKIPVD